MSGIESVLEGLGGGEGGVRTNQSAGFPAPGEGSLRGAQLFKYRHPAPPASAETVNKETILCSVDTGVGDSNYSGWVMKRIFWEKLINYITTGTA